MQYKQQEGVEAEGRLMWQDSMNSDTTGDSLLMHLHLQNSDMLSAGLEENDRSLSSLSRTSSSSSSSRGMYGGTWNSDTLAEMFEGVVGALLLDCGSDYETLKQLLLPWVAASLDASRAEAAAEAAAQVMTAAARPDGVGMSVPAAAAVPAGKPAALSAASAAAKGRHVADGTLQAAGSSAQQQLQGLQAALEQQLLRHSGLSFDSQEPLAVASQHMLAVLRTGESAAEAETLKFLGFSLLQFAAALQAYCRQTGLHAGQWLGPADGMMMVGSEAVGCGSWRQREDRNGSSSSSSVDSSSTSGRKAQAVHRMSQHAKELTTVRHRCVVRGLLRF
jgi:hypothetical protein